MSDCTTDECLEILHGDSPLCNETLKLSKVWIPSHLDKPCVHALDKLLRVVLLEASKLAIVGHTLLPPADVLGGLGMELVGGLEWLARPPPEKVSRGDGR